MRFIVKTTRNVSYDLSKKSKSIGGSIFFFGKHLFFQPIRKRVQNEFKLYLNIPEIK